MLPAVIAAVVKSTVFGEQTANGFVIIRTGAGFTVTVTVLSTEQFKRSISLNVTVYVWGVNGLAQIISVITVVGDVIVQSVPDIPGVMLHKKVFEAFPGLTLYGSVPGQTD